MENIFIPVLVVDDEYLIRSLVRNSVDWESLGFHIVGESEDGESALSLVESLRPRLMIVDINIPFLNGLDLSQTVRLRYPFIKIIILTGYEDFQYARKALQAGVLNYILKPIDTEEFKAALLSAREVILTEERNRLTAMQTQVVNGEPEPEQVKMRFLRTLLSEGALQDKDEILERFRLFRIKVQVKPFIVCLVDIQPGKAVLPFPFAENTEFFLDEKGRVVLLTNEDGRTTRTRDKTYYELCEGFLKSNISEEYEVTIGISGPAEEPSDIKSAYRQAEEALNERFYRGCNKIYVYQKPSQPAAEPTDLPPIPDKDALLFNFRNGNQQAVEKIIQNFLNNLAEKKPSRRYCEVAFMEIITIANEFLEENGISLKSFLRPGDDVLSVFGRLSTFSKMKNWIVGLIDEVCRKNEVNRVSKTQMIVRKAKKFIEWNFAKKSLTLERIAEYVSVTPSYISTVFKKEMGVSLSEHIMDVRLKKAKTLMDENSMLPIMDISNLVGYSDPYYFSKCFRKKYGISPSRYLRTKLP